MKTPHPASSFSNKPAKLKIDFTWPKLCWIFVELFEPTVVYSEVAKRLINCLIRGVKGNFYCKYFQVSCIGQRHIGYELPRADRAFIMYQSTPKHTTTEVFICKFIDISIKQIFVKLPVYPPDKIHYFAVKDL